ncbi:MAG: TIM barrel protein [Acidimicrobiia bacterium]|nr:TIM barrel protein [Acidimicrobiia bacterium]
MKLGFLTAPFPTTPIGEVADWAVDKDFASLEIAAWPAAQGETRRYAGTSHVDVNDMTKDRADDFVGEITDKGLEISGLGYYPNLLHPDPEHRTEVKEHLMKVITAASLMGLPVVNTFIGADHNKTQADNWEDAKTVWADIVAHARDSDILIAIENCPMIFSNDEWPSGHNLAYSPAMWRTMFEEFGETVGLNFDPSHLVWLMIDIERAVTEFGSRIYHVQAKDVMIDREGLYQHGVLSAGMGWQIPRLPGLGDVDWAILFRTLYRVGYQGHIIIEHEDRDFEETDELVKRGFILARDVLAPYIV